MPKPLVVYYSYSNTTRGLAEVIAGVTGGTLRELLPQEPYSFARHGAVKDARNEIERGYCPKLVSGLAPVQAYDPIFLGTPNWFKSFAPPVLSFLRGVALEGKTILPFCTHGGGGLGRIESAIQAACPNARLLPGFAATSDFDAAQVRAWIDTLPIL